MAVYSHFAWILPSELIDAHIFTKEGGFAYCKLHDADGHEASVSGVFFPVVPQHNAGVSCVPQVYSPSCLIEELWLDAQKEEVEKLACPDSLNGRAKWYELKLQLFEPTVTALGIESVLRHGNEKRAG